MTKATTCALATQAEHAPFPGKAEARAVERVTKARFAAALRAGPVEREPSAPRNVDFPGASSQPVSIPAALVRRPDGAANGAATHTNRIRESTMRFMIIGRATKESEAGILPGPDAFAAMQEYNETLVKSGILLAAEGLAPSAKGARVKFSGDKRTVTDGPFTESKELIAGFTILQVNSLEEAIEWVKRAPNLSPDGETEVEIRKLMDMEDFGEEFTPNAEIAKVKIE